MALANDFDGDGRLDLFVGNDAFLDTQERNALYLRVGSDHGVPQFADRTPPDVVIVPTVTAPRTVRTPLRSPRPRARPSIRLRGQRPLRPPTPRRGQEK